MDGLTATRRPTLSVQSSATLTSFTPVFCPCSDAHKGNHHTCHRQREEVLREPRIHGKTYIFIKTWNETSALKFSSKMLIDEIMDQIETKSGRSNQRYGVAHKHAVTTNCVVSVCVVNWLLILHAARSTRLLILRDAKWTDLQNCFYMSCFRKICLETSDETSAPSAGARLSPNDISQCVLIHQARAFENHGTYTVTSRCCTPRGEKVNTQETHLRQLILPTSSSLGLVGVRNLFGSCGSSICSDLRIFANPRSALEHWHSHPAILEICFHDA